MMKSLLSNSDKKFQGFGGPSLGTQNFYNFQNLKQADVLNYEGGYYVDKMDGVGTL